MSLNLLLSASDESALTPSALRTYAEYPNWGERATETLAAAMKRVQILSDFGETEIPIAGTAGHFLPFPELFEETRRHQLVSSISDLVENLRRQLRHFPRKDLNAPTHVLKSIGGMVHLVDELLSRLDETGDINDQIVSVARRLAFHDTFGERRSNDSHDNESTTVFLEIFEWNTAIVYAALAAARPTASISQDNNATMSAVNEFRRTSEDLAQVIERAADTGQLDDREVRLYRKWLAESDGASPDVVDFLERKLISTLPEVLSALDSDRRSDNESNPVTKALADAANGAAEAAQLDSLDRALEFSADSLEQTADAASKLDPDAQPYLPKFLDRAETVTSRLANSLERLNDALDHLRTKSGNFGKRIASMTATAGGIATGAASGGLVASAGAPVEVSMPMSTIAGALITRWLYSRRRRLDPSLPPALAPPNDGEQA